MHKTGWLLIGAAVVLEYSHMQVMAGTTATGTLASIEGQLANIDELTGANFRVSFVLAAIGIYMLVKG